MDYSQNILADAYIFLLSDHHVGKHSLNPYVVLPTTCEYPRWKTTMKEEFHPLQKNDTWDLVILPSGRNLVKCKWIFKTKLDVDGSPLNIRKG